MILTTVILILSIVFVAFFVEKTIKDIEEAINYIDIYILRCHECNKRNGNF